MNISTDHRNAQEIREDELVERIGTITPTAADSLESREAALRQELGKIEAERTHKAEIVRQWDVIAARHITLRRKLNNADGLISYIANASTEGTANLLAKLEEQSIVSEHLAPIALSLAQAAPTVDWLQKKRLGIVDELTEHEQQVRAFAKANGVPKDVTESVFK